MDALSSTSFTAIGTTALVAVCDPARLPEAASILRRELDAVDRACSRFRPDSELSRLNARAGRPTRVSVRLLEAVEVALGAAAHTDGAVDPTVGRALLRLGYDRDFSALAGSPPRRRIRVARAPGWQRVHVDRETGTVELDDGVSLDLGATAKALAADAAARAVHEAVGCGTLVSLGGDVSLAGEPPAAGWPVRVTDDHRLLDGAGQTVALRDGGLATSSTRVRRWRAGGGERHHIVDPASGLPADEVWRTATVAASSCVAANAASTTAVVRGEGAPAWLERAGLPARLVRGDGTVVRVCDWPEEGR
jgi:thiamine biosynthesis lipoprotein ApbE